MQEPLQPQTTLQNANSLPPVNTDSKGSLKNNNLPETNPVSQHDETNSISKIQQQSLDPKKTIVLANGLSNVLSNSDFLKVDSMVGAPANDSENNSKVKFERGLGSPDNDFTHEPHKGSKHLGDISLPHSLGGRSRENSIDLKQKVSFSPQLTRDLQDPDANMAQFRLNNEEDPLNNSATKSEKRKNKEGIFMKGLKKLTKSMSKSSTKSPKTLAEDAKADTPNANMSTSRTLKSIFGRKKNTSTTFSMKKIEVDVSQNASAQQKGQEEEYNLDEMEEKVRVSTPQGELLSKQTLKEKDSLKEKDLDAYSIEKRQHSQDITRQVSHEMGRLASHELMTRQVSHELMPRQASHELMSRQASHEIARLPSQDIPATSNRSIQYTQPQNSKENLILPTKRDEVHRKSRSSSRVNDRRRVSFGNNLQLEQAMIVEKAQKWPKIIKLIKYSLLFIVASAISYAITIVLSSLITYPYKLETKRAWIGQFFHGFLISTLSIVFLKAAINRAIQKAEKKDTTRLFNAKKFRKAYGKRDELILTCFLPLISGLLMYAWYKQLFDPVVTSSEFFGAEFLTVLFNIIIISLYYLLKNNSLQKKALKNQRQGFFFVPVYKDFLSDLYGVRAVLQNKSEAATQNTPEDEEKKVVINEEGIDKYKPRRAYEIVTSLKVFGSQLLIVILYLQFITLIGLINKFIDNVEQDKVIPALIILIVYRPIMKIFTKTLEYFNKLIKLDMLVYVHYLNNTFTGMFYQQVLFHVNDMKYVWMMIAWNAVYKILVYIIFGVKIDYWKIDVMEKLKQKILTKRKKTEKKKDNTAAGNSVEIRKSLRSDTLSMKYKDEVEKAIEARRKRKEKIQTLFAIRFVCITYNDILYSAVTLGLLLAYSIISQDPLESFLGEDRTKIYIKGSWIKLLLDGCMLILVTIAWKLSKNYKFLDPGQGLTIYFQKYLLPCLFISLTLFISFIFLSQAIATGAILSF